MSIYQQSLKDIQSKMTDKLQIWIREKLLTVHFHQVSTCDLDLWLSHPQMYTAVLQVIIYQLAKYEKDPMKNGRESQHADSGKEIKEETS